MRVLSASDRFVRGLVPALSVWVLLLAARSVLAAAGCSLEELAATAERGAIYVLRNEFLEVRVNPGRGGGVEGMRFKPTQTMLALPPAQAQGQRSFEDRVYRQYTEGGKTIFEQENDFRGYAYTAEVVSDSPAEVGLKVSCQGRSRAFQWLTVSKTYVLRAGESALYVRHAMTNNSERPERAGLWVPTFMRATGVFSERNTFYAPTEGGVRAIAHPGKDAKGQGNWVMDPPQPWKAVIGSASRAGVVALLEYGSLSSYYDWYRTSGFISTFEWMMREQQVPPGGTFATEYVLLPVGDFRRVDGVVGDRIACGISFPPGILGAGEQAMIEVTLASPVSETLAVAVAVSAEGGGAVTGEGTDLEPLVLAPGHTAVLSRPVTVPEQPQWRVAVTLAQGREVLGTVARGYRAGDGPEPVALARRESPKQGDAIVYPVLHQKLSGHEDIEFRAATDVTAKSAAAGDSADAAAALSARERHRLEALKTYPGLDSIEDISGEVVTPHTVWMKPSVLGPVRVLYLCELDTPGVVDTRKRNVLECAQRLELEYAFVPLLKRVAVYASLWDQTLAADLDPYVLDRVREEIRGDYDVVVVDGLDFAGVQDEFSELLLNAVLSGRGLVFSGCRNLPESIETHLARSGAALPALFYCIPEVDPRLPLARKLPAVCRTGVAGRGRMVAVSDRPADFPCVPPECRGARYPNTAGREIPYWEYLWLPRLKAIVWACGRPVTGVVEALGLVAGELTVTHASGTQVPLALDVVFRNRYNQQVCARVYALGQGGNRTKRLLLPPLPKGLHLLEYRVRTPDGKVCDFGCREIVVPGTCEVRKVSFDRKWYELGQPVAATVELTGVPAGSRLEAEVEDTYERIVWRSVQELSAGQERAALTVSVPRPLTVLHRLFVSVVSREDRILERHLAEFSMPFQFLPMDELVAYQWYSQPAGMQRWRDLGFDCLISSYRRVASDGLLEALSNMNIRPYSIGIGSVAGSPYHKGDGHYYGMDLVRDPCLSAPEWWDKTRVEILKHAEQHTYYGVHDYHLVDEMHLGPAVCFSPHCLARFRDYLEAQYGTLEALNREWDTTFAEWAQVKPLNVMEVDASKANLMSWLDHRMFMNLVFAGWVDGTRQILQEVNPHVKVGLSGTTGPGTTYNWWELMQVMECLANYGGIQNDLIRSFQAGGARTGKWTGGYVPVWKDGEKYERTAPWFGVFNDNRGYYFWHGSTKGYTLFGDLRASPNLQYVVEELRELKRGTAKLLFNAERVSDGIALHYSQSSMFAATATLGKEFWDSSLDSWKYLLEDLGLTFHFVSYEQLARNPLDRSKVGVFVLPLSLCLSSAEIATLRRFVEAGGTLVADYAPGLYDEHGRPASNQGLQELFGIRRVRSDVRTATCRLGVRAAPEHGLRERSSIMRYGEDGIALTTGRAFADTGNPEAPAVIVSRFGKGRAVLLNCVLGDYARVTLGGEGGETAAIGRGDPAITTPMRDLVGDVLAGVGVESPVRIVTTGTPGRGALARLRSWLPLGNSGSVAAGGTDFLPLTTVIRYRDGDARYVGILKNDSSLEPIIPSDFVPVRISFGATGHLYDVRSQEYLGPGGSVRTSIAPAKAKLYAILPYKVRSVTLQGPERARAGELVSMDVCIAASGGGGGNHVLRIEVFDPAGTQRVHYSRNLRVTGGRGTFVLPTALNDVSGRWRVVATDVVSGKRGSASVSLH